METFEKNINIESLFTESLDKNIFIKHEGKQAQNKIGDYYNIITKHNIDFKVDTYDNDNIVLEVKQISGTNWIDELDENTFIGFVKLSTGVIYYWSIGQLRLFRESNVYKFRKEITAWSKTIFKNFRLKELPPPAYVTYFNNIPFNRYIKKDVLGDSKYINERRISCT